MKILLTAINAKYIHSNLAIYDLQAFTREAGVQVDIREYTINRQMDDILQDLYRQHPQLLVFSCYIWNIEYVITTAKEFHKLCPFVPIWVGGPEVSFDCEEFLRRHAWAAGCMRGEGEETFLELCRSYLQDTGREGIRGITWRKEDGTFIAEEDRPVMDLSRVPFPYKNTKDFEHRIIYYESSRGCPFSCSYCLSSVDKCLRFRSLDLVLPELQFFLDHRVPQVKFVDRTFNCKHAHSMAIWKYILDHDNGITNFHFEIAADILNEEEIRLISQMRPGLIQLEIGVQSTNAETIREIHRVMDFAHVSQVVRRIKAGHNIHQHLDLIAGLPHEDVESFRRSFNDVYALQPDQLQLGFLKVLKGSFMAEQAAAYGCVCHDEPPYEVLYTDWITYDDVLRLKRVEEMTEVYYNSGQFSHTLPEVLKSFSTPFDFFDELGLFYEEKGYMEISHTRIRRYEILLEFLSGKEETRDRGEIFREWMLYDLYERENLKTRPSWAPDLKPYKRQFRRFYAGEEEQRSFLKDHEGYDARTMASMTHIEVFSHIYEQPQAVLFSYRTRDPLDHNARCQKLAESIFCE